MRPPLRRALRAAGLCVGVLLAFVAGWYIVGRLTSPLRAVRVRALPGASPQQPVRLDGALRLGAYNIAHGRGLALKNWRGGDRRTRTARLKSIARTLRDADLDVVVLNEVDLRCVWSHNVNQAELIAREAGFHYRAEQRNYEVLTPLGSLCFGNAVLSRFPIVDARPVDLPVYSRWEALLAGKKRAMVCTVEFPDGRRLRVMPVHFEHRSEVVRLGCVKAIEPLRRETDVPLVCMGDFNSTRTGYPRADTGDGDTTAVSYLLEGDAFRALPEGAPTAEDFTFRSSRPDRVVDWTMTPKAWRIVSKTAPAASDSDHRPVIVEALP